VQDDIKMKALMVLLGLTLIVPAFLFAYQPRRGMEKPAMADELWSLIQSPAVSLENVVAFSKDYPAGFKDASMGKAMAGPIKLEGG
jgi:hypothetical protein